MTCIQARQHLECYADGEVSAEVRSSVEVHIQECPPCREAVRRWKLLRRCASRTVAAAAIPPGLNHRVLTAIAAERLAARRRTWLRNGALAIAACLAAAVGLGQFTGVPGLPRLWGPTAAVVAPRLVNPANLAFICTYCTKNHHDALGVAGLAASAAHEKLMDFAAARVLLPDLSDRGYVLDGACHCFPLGPDVQAIHAFYKGPADKSLSVFTVGAQFSLEGARDLAAAAGATLRRPYKSAQEGGVHVLQWDTCSGTYVLAGDMAQDDLLALANLPRFD